MLRRCRCSRGFTLLEVMVVIALVAVLCSLVLRMAEAAWERTAGSRARSELALMASALERYRAVHGDYPRLVDAEPPERTLYRALVGDPDIEGAPRVRYLTGASIEIGDRGGGAVLLDPWGHPYVYRYRRADDGLWRRRGYVLLSLGPSAARGPGGAGGESPRIPETGILPADYHEHADTHDNILATH